MIKQDNLFLSEDAMPKLMAGVKKVSDAVGMTLGTAGKNSLVECLESPGHYSTNDGFTIANSIKLDNPIEELGRKILVEAINRANKSSGDGSSTTCVLTSAILEEGQKHLKESSPMEIKRSLEECIPIIEKSINDQKREITVDSVAQVATTSAEDEEIGNRIQGIYQKIGKDGVIQWDISKTPEDSYTIGNGLTINGATYVSPYMCDITQEGNLSNLVRWSDVSILLCRQKITSSNDFNGLFSTLYAKDKRELVIFCEEIEVPVITSLIMTRAQKGFKSVVVKMPILWKEDWWEDLKLASGATIIGGTSGISLINATESHLGHFDHITITKEDTYVDGIKNLSKHIKALKADGSDESLQRAERLNTKTARYFIGAYSDSALAYRRLKVEDAINSASCALDNGIVAGGGIALLTAGHKLTNDKIGGKILIRVLEEPFRKIMENAGIKDGELYFDGKMGYNSKTKELVNMFDAGIVDSVDVTLSAVKNAIGVAAGILTIGSVITLPKEDYMPQMPNLTR